MPPPKWVTSAVSTSSSSRTKPAVRATWPGPDHTVTWTWPPTRRADSASTAAAMVAGEAVVRGLGIDPEQST